MNKLLLGFAVTALLFSTACKKNDTTSARTASGGSWTFKGKTYQQNGCYAYSPGVFVATSSNPGSMLIFSFYDTIPTTPGTYSEDVIHNEQIGQVSIEFDDSATGLHYLPPNVPGTIVPVSISVSAAGKRSITGSNITLQDLTTGVGGSSDLTLDITEH